jgi:hypothetical protein
VVEEKLATSPETDPVNGRLLKSPHPVLVMVNVPVRLVPVCTKLADTPPVSKSQELVQVPDQFPVKSAHKAGDNWKQIIITERRGIIFDITLLLEGLQVN